jgi:hypothetical protein
MPMCISDSGVTHPWNFASEEITALSRLEERPPLMYGQQLRLLFLLGYGLCVFVFPAHSQTTQEEPLPGPDSHETGQGPHGHLFGEWGGVRTDAHPSREIICCWSQHVCSGPADPS